MHLRKTVLALLASCAGLVVGVAPAVAATPAQAAASCPYKRLCVWDGPNGTGAEHPPFYYCQFVNLGNEGWNDRISSFINNQTPGTTASFYNWGNGAWHLVLTSTAPHSMNVLPAGVDNVIDAIQVC